MDFQLNEEQRAIQDMARAFTAEHFTPNAGRWDREEIFPVPELRKAAELGLAAIYTGEEHGGSGLSRLDAAIIFEELAAGCPSTAAYLSIHNMVCWMVDRFGSAEVRARFLPALTRMEHMASYCLTEPGAGSDAAALRTGAVPEGNSIFRMNGSKAFISGGPTSDVYAVMARTGGAGADGVSCLLVERGTEGLSFGKKEHKMGWHSQHTSMVSFENCPVPRDNLLGREGEGFRIAMAGLDGGRVNIAACSLGGARAALEAALSYAGERAQFGRTLDSFQAIRFKLADMATELDAARLMVHRAADSIDRQDPEMTKYCAMTKRFVTDLCMRICDEALQIHGGYGYLGDFPLERLVRDLRVHRILEGTNEIMRVIIARKLLAE